MYIVNINNNDGQEKFDVFSTYLKLIQFPKKQTNFEVTVSLNLFFGCRMNDFSDIIKYTIYP